MEESPLAKALKILSSFKETTPTTQPDDLSKEEEKDFESEKKTLELDHQKLLNDSLERIIGLRESYSKRIFWFLVCWSTLVILILVFQGFKIWNFELPESVLGVLVGSTTANVIALVGLVIKGLFPPNLFPQK